MTARRQLHRTLLPLAAFIIVLGACTSQNAALPAAPFAPSLSPLPLPTRIPTPTPLPPDFWLEQLQLALLQDDAHLPEAEIAWEAALRHAPDDGAVQRAGARLALRQGDIAAATERVNAALRLDPEDADAWLLAGVIAQRLGDPATMQEAFRTAETLDPTLAESLFLTRWRVALEMGDTDTLGQLAQFYTLTHLEDPLSAYFRAETLLAAGYPRTALELLILRMDSASPGVLWYTLGRIYLALDEPLNAIITLETANALLARGDSSLSLASDDPTRDVSTALGRAYLAVRRCDEARRLLLLLATPYPEIAPLVEEAQRCPPPAPTPTFAPWLP